MPFKLFTWTAVVNGVAASVLAPDKATAKQRLRERFAMKVLPRKIQLKRID